MSENETFQRVILITITIIGGFIFLSMIFSFVLLWTGRVDEVTAWRPLFDIVAVMVGAIGGFITGQTVERGRDPEE